MIDLKSQTLEEMTATLKEMGEPAFRGKQVFYLAPYAPLTR